MNNRKLTFTRKWFTGAWIGSLLSAVMVLIFAFYGPLLDYMIPQPDVARDFMVELGLKYNDITGNPVILVNNHQTVKDDTKLVNQLFDESERQEKIIKSILEGKRNVKASSNSNSSKKSVAVNVTNKLNLNANANTNANSNVDVNAVKQKKLELEVLNELINKVRLARFKLDSQGHLSFMRLKYVSPNSRSSTPDWLSRWYIPQDGEMLIGATPDLKAKPLEYAVIDMAGLPLANLHWRSNDDIDFESFNRSFQKVLAREEANVENFVDDKMVERMRLRVGANFYAASSYLRWVLLPMTCTLFFLSSVLCWMWYRNYLRSSNLVMLPPGLLVAFWVKDLKRLTKSTKQKLANMKLEELERSARRTVRVKPNINLSAKALTSRVELKPALEPQDPRDLQLKRIQMLVKDFQVISENVDNNVDAWRIYEQALVIDNLGEKRDLLILAIAELKKVNELQKPIVKAEEPVTEKSESPMVYLTLRQRLDEIFPVPNFLPADVNARMVREILLVLLNVGKDVSFFGSNYMPDDAFKRDITQRYEVLKLRFIPKVFDSAESWLIDHGVLTAKKKTGAYTRSLASHVKNGTTPEAQELIGLAIQVHQSKKQRVGVNG